MFLMIVLTVGLLVEPIVCEFEYRLYPPTSPTSSLKRRVFEFVPEKDWGIDVWFLVEFLTSPNMSTAEVSSFHWTNERAPYSPKVRMSLGENWTTKSGPQPVRISAWSHNRSACLANYSDIPSLVYWDFRFTQIDFNLEFRLGSRPGELWVIPKTVGGGPLEEDPLMQQVRVMKYSAILPSNPTSGDPAMGSPNKVPDGYALHHVFWEAPRVFYWSLRAYNGWDDSRSPAASLISDKTWFFATVCCSEVLGCPNVDADFAAAGHSIWTLDPCIPGDHQFAPLKDDVLIVEGTALFFWVYGVPDFILVDLPNVLELRSHVNDLEPFNDDFYDLAEEDSARGAGYHTYRIENGHWGDGAIARSLPLFRFRDGAEIGRKYEMLLKYGGPPNTAWQTIKVTPTMVPDNPHSPAKRLRIGYTWSTMSYYENFSVYADLGFNLVPEKNGHVETNATLLNRWTPAYRRSVWDADRPGMLFGPEASLFAYGNYDIYLRNLFYVLQSSSVVDSWLPLDLENRATEIAMWQDAIDFYQSTGHLDIAYDGYFFRRHLEVFEDYLLLTLPENVNLDIEGYSPASSAFISQSANFERRRHPGETDEQLFGRVAGTRYSINPLRSRE